MVATLTARVLPKFPTRVVNGPGVQVTKANGTWTLGLDTDSLGELPVTDPANSYVAVQLPDGTYAKVPMDEVLSGQIIAGIYQSAVIVQGLSIPTLAAGGPAGIETLGYNVPADGGGNNYARAGTGALYGSIQSADGQWWAPQVGPSGQAYWSAGMGATTRVQPPFVYRNRAMRWFLGAAANGNNIASRDGTGTWGWLLSPVDGPSYLARDAAFLYMNDGVDAVGLSSMVFLDNSHEPPSPDAIAIAAYVRNNRDAKAGWAHYIEVCQQNATGGANVMALEIDVRNASGVNSVSDPYFISFGASGIWMTAGGDASNGPVTTDHSNTAIGINANSGNVPLKQFNSGIIIDNRAITGSDGSNAATGDGPGAAIQMARGHEVQWYDVSRRKSFFIRGAQLSTDPATGVLVTAGSVNFLGNAGVGTLTIAQAGTIANGFGLTAVAAGSSPIISVNGSDTNIDIALLPKGTGIIKANAAMKAWNTTAIPAGGTAGMGLLMSIATNFGVFFGSGAPTLSAAKGSLYLRSDGTTTNDRMYVNTNGSTTWTAVTTAA